VPHNAIEMNENHRRGIATTLRLFDEMLCRFEEWARGREIHSVLYEEKNGLSVEQREQLLQETAALRELLRRFRDDLSLSPGVQYAENDIWGGCSGFWENLVELESKHLRRYGDVSPALSEYMDRNVPGLITGLERHLAVLGPGRRGKKPRRSHGSGESEGSVASDGSVR